MEEPNKQTRELLQAKSANLDRLVAALSLPAGTPQEALADSVARVEELRRHQGQFAEMLCRAVDDGDVGTIFELKELMVNTAAMTEACRVDALIATGFVLKVDAQRKKVERLEASLSAADLAAADQETSLRAAIRVLDKPLSTIQ